MSVPTVLIIDDDTNYLALLAEGLDDQFQVSCAKNLDEAEHYVNTNQTFDIALVDEHISHEKGSEWIKSKIALRNVAKSFVLYSGLATEEAILKGLACGADDFLAKPISLHALNIKLVKLIDYQEKINSFQTEIHSKDNVINISMAQASKYGSCMQLTSRLNQCFSFEQVRDETFKFLKNENLPGCIAFYPLKERPIFFHSVKGVCSPVEIEVMELLKVKSRLFRFGNRTIFNHQLVSLLILNLEDGSVDTDIYIDALASVIECIGARMAFITYKMSLVGVQEKIKQAVTKTKRMLAISKQHQQEVMNEIVQNIGMSFHVLEMSDEQELYLMDLVHTALKKHTQDDINFSEVTLLLDLAIANVDTLQELNTTSTVESNDIFDDEEDLF
jgi:response regulator of citrate/malate metabolism